MRRRRNAPAFRALIQHRAAQIGVEPERVQIQRMRAKWASCSPAGRLTFSQNLLSQKRAFQEAVVVHELLHLRVPNHGRLFKSLMTAYVPDGEHVMGRRGGRRGACVLADS